MNSPRISIVTPCYNSTGFLHRLHASLCRQSFRDFEWITVDDKSSDATVEMLKALPSPGHGGMRAYALPQNSGGGVATGFGVEQASGEILLIVDHDDELEDFALQAVVDEWVTVASRENMGGIFFRRSSPATGGVIGEALDEGAEFTMSWQANRKPSITDGVIAFRSEVAKRYFNARSLESICLFGVPLNQMTKQHRLRAGSPDPILRYYRDNPESQTNSVKVSRKTVYTYAKYLDEWDRYYFLRPLHWIRHTIALIKFSLSVHGVPWFHHRYIESVSIRLFSWLLMPLGILRYMVSERLTVIEFVLFDFDALEDLRDLHENPC